MSHSAFKRQRVAGFGAVRKLGGLDLRLWSSSLGLAMAGFGFREADGVTNFFVDDAAKKQGRSCFADILRTFRLMLLPSPCKR